MADSDFEIRSTKSRYEQTEETAQTKAQENEQADVVSLVIAGETEAEGGKKAASFEDEYLTVSIRYKDPDAEESRLQELPVDATAELDEMSDNMSWAGGVAQAGMLLRGSEYAGSSDWEEVRSRLRELTGGDEFREEFIYLLGRASQLG
jgi:Ca-activated chloride channel family protein